MQQEVRSIRMLKDNFPKSANYGEEVDFSKLMIEVKYLDGSIIQVPFSEIEKYGITCNLPIPFISQPDDNNYAEEKNFDLKFTHEKSISAYTFDFQVSRKRIKKQPLKIEFKIKGIETPYSIDLDEEEFMYGITLDTKAFEIIQNAISNDTPIEDVIDFVKVFDSDDKNKEIEIKKYQLFEGDAPRLSIDIKPLSNALPTDPVKVEYKFNNFVIDMVNNNAFDKNTVASFDILKQPNKTEYIKGETLDFTGLQMKAKDMRGNEKIINHDELSTYLFDVFPGNGEILNNIGENIVTIRHKNFIITMSGQRTFKINVTEPDNIPAVKTEQSATEKTEDTDKNQQTTEEAENTQDIDKDEQATEGTGDIQQTDKEQSAIEGEKEDTQVTETDQPMDTQETNKNEATPEGSESTQQTQQENLSVKNPSTTPVQEQKMTSKYK